MSAQYKAECPLPGHFQSPSGPLPFRLCAFSKSPSRFSKRPSLESASETEKTGSKVNVQNSASSNRSSTNSKASTNYVNNQRQSMQSNATNSRPASQSLHQEYSEYATWKNQFQERAIHFFHSWGDFRTLITASRTETLVCMESSIIPD